ncbi:MAG TPA: hypothetical protein VKV06_11885, partial [Acidimicrobiales bacterium]|nr:hypothetical protein [Acidimicrobiales bacterium]
TDLERAGYRRRADVDGYPVLRSVGLNLAHASPVKTTLLGIKTVELGPTLIAGGGSQVTPTALAAALDDRQAKHPLSADPDVDALISALTSAGGAADTPVQVLGSSLLASPLGAAGGPRMSPSQVAALLHRFDLDRLRTPATYAGLRYVTSNHPTCAVVAATLYPTPAAAKTAATVLGPVLRHGTSFSTNLRYDALWTVQSVAAHGRTVVARLNLRSPYALIESLQRIDFPLFWQPPFLARS